MSNTKINVQLRRLADKLTDAGLTDVLRYSIRKTAYIPAVLSLALGLTACGGGGGGSSTTSSNVPATSSTTQLIAAPDTVRTKQNTSVTIEVLANDRGFDAVTPSVSISYGPKHGTVVIREDGSIAYSPAVGFSGSDSFVYKIAGGGDAFAIATATITVTCSDCVVDDQQMTLNWKRVPGNVLGYLVYFGKGLIKNPTLVTPVLAKTKVTFDAQADLGLSPGDYVCFWVQAVNTAGTSDLSTPACGLV